jgi:CSLREA domain-containing protein
MRIITRASHSHRSPSIRGRVVTRRSALAVAIVGSATMACSGDVVKTNPMAPSSPDFSVYSNGTWLVNSLADPGDGTCTNSECTLREAIAVAQTGEHIAFKNNLGGRIDLTAGELVIPTGVSIDGPGADKLAISGQGVSRVVKIAPGPAVTISSLTIMRGNAGSDPATDDGGGILVETGGGLTLIGMVVTGNRADNGGGIASFGGRLAVIGSTVSTNNAIGAGGGIYVASGASPLAQLTVRRSTISDNTASGAAGIYFYCEDGCPATIASSTITANNATSGTGGIFNYSQGITIYNTIVAGNRVNGSLLAAEADCQDAAGLFNSLGYNLTSAGTGCGLAGPTEVIVDASQVFATVLYPLLEANGSSRPTHALIERGYAVDAGYCPGENGDQRGFPRPYDDPRMPNALDSCDIGAFEWQPTDTKGKKP